MDYEGETTQIKASEEGNTQIVKLLIVKGAEVNAKDSYGESALI